MAAKAGPRRLNAQERYANRLAQEGYRVINPRGRLPKHIATLGPYIFAIVERRGKQTHLELRRRHQCLDGTITWSQTGQRAETLDEVIGRLVGLGANVRQTNHKAPDLLVEKDGVWAAIGLVDLPAGSKSTYFARELEGRFRVWDEVWVRRLDGAPAINDEKV